MSSKYGRICSNRPMSLNSIGSNVGHQHIAKFLLSILFNFEFSATLQKFNYDIGAKIKTNVNRLSMSFKGEKFKAGYAELNSDLHRFKKHFNYSNISHLTKCWNMNFKTWKLTAGSFSSMLLRANKRQLRSVFTSKLPVVVDIGFSRVPVRNSYIHSSIH